MLLKFAESGHPIFRSTTPLSRGKLKSKGKGKVSIHFSADQDTVDKFIALFFLSISSVSTEQWQLYAMNMKATKIARGKPVILVGQSVVLGEIKAEVPVHDEEPRDDQIILQQYVQQIESLSPENRLSKFCKEAGFMRVVEVGQYFVRRDVGEFQQTVACREYTLPRDDKASQPKGWIRGNMRIGLVLKVTTSFQHFKYGIEIRIKSVNQDDSHSWVRIFSWNGQICERLHQRRHRKSCRSTRRGRCTNKLKCGCNQVESKSKTSTEGIYWHDNYTIM